MLYRSTQFPLTQLSDSSLHPSALSSFGIRLANIQFCWYHKHSEPWRTFLGSVFNVESLLRSIDARRTLAFIAAAYVSCTMTAILARTLMHHRQNPPRSLSGSRLRIRRPFLLSHTLLERHKGRLSDFILRSTAQRASFRTSSTRQDFLGYRPIGREGDILDA